MYLHKYRSGILSRVPGLQLPRQLLYSLAERLCPLAVDAVQSLPKHPPEAQTRESTL